MTAAEDPKFFFGKGEFTLLNGDRYVGDYGAHRNGVVWREGLGKYISEDDQIYEGEWIDDKLVDGGTVAISYPDGVKFKGSISNDKYSGPGVYTFDNEMEISCTFNENKPSGPMTLFDLDEKVWTGTAGENRAVLLPENIFFAALSDTQGMGELRTDNKDAPFAQKRDKRREEEKDYNASEERSAVFAKSTKTPYEIDFKECKWYQRYLRYQTMVEAIAAKSSQNLVLTEEEAKWYAKARQNRHEVKRKFVERKKKEAIKDESVETPFAKSFGESCPAMRVFRPSVDTKDQ